MAGSTVFGADLMLKAAAVVGVGAATAGAGYAGVKSVRATHAATPAAFVAPKPASTYRRDGDAPSRTGERLRSASGGRSCGAQSPRRTRPQSHAVRAVELPPAVAAAGDTAVATAAAGSIAPPPLPVSVPKLPPVPPVSIPPPPPLPPLPVLPPPPPLPPLPPLPPIK